jgi:ferredoxin
MRVCVDPELCGGCGPCVDICPETFAAELEDACREAADSCPSEAISIAE